MLKPPLSGNSLPHPLPHQPNPSDSQQGQRASAADDLSPGVNLGPYIHNSDIVQVYESVCMLDYDLNSCRKCFQYGL